jgi:hypothetical protein
MRQVIVAYESRRVNQPPGAPDAPMLAPVGHGVAPTPWRALQIAAWAAIKTERRI